MLCLGRPQNSPLQTLLSELLQMLVRGQSRLVEVRTVWSAPSLGLHQTLFRTLLFRTPWGQVPLRTLALLVLRILLFRTPWGQVPLRTLALLVLRILLFRTPWGQVPLRTLELLVLRILLESQRKRRKSKPGPTFQSELRSMITGDLKKWVLWYENGCFDTIVAYLSRRWRHHLRGTIGEKIREMNFAFKKKSKEV